MLEQSTGNPDTEGSSFLSNHCFLNNFVLIFFYKPDVCKTLKVYFSGNENNIIIKYFFPWKEEHFFFSTIFN